MGWPQRLEAGRQTKIERQNALHRGFQEPTSDLWFRLTHAQRHRSISILVLCTVGLALAGVVIGRSQAVYAIAVLLALGVLLGLVSTLVTVRDFTHFSESGIESRYRGRWRETKWADVAALDIDEVTGRGAATYLVAVRKDGKRVRLGAPWQEGAVGDPDFDTKLEGILAYCRIQAIVAGSGSPPVATARKTGS